LRVRCSEARAGWAQRLHVGSWSFEVSETGPGRDKKLHLRLRPAVSLSRHVQKKSFSPVHPERQKPPRRAICEALGAAKTFSSLTTGWQTDGEVRFLHSEYGEVVRDGWTVGPAVGDVDVTERKTRATTRAPGVPRLVDWAAQTAPCSWIARSRLRSREAGRNAIVVLFLRPTPAGNDSRHEVGDRLLVAVSESGSGCCVRGTPARWG